MVLYADPANPFASINADGASWLGVDPVLFEAGALVGRQLASALELGLSICRPACALC